MKILAFETSTKFLSVSVLENENILSNFHKDMALKQSSLLIPTVEKMLKKARLTIKDIGLIGAGIGPGSFTGLRIGIAAAKALSLATSAPVIGISTLDAIAYNYIKEDGYIAPILDARKNKVYSAVYESDLGEAKRISGYLLVDIDSLLGGLKGPTLFFGDGIEVYGKIMREKSPLVKISSDKDWYPRAEVVAKLALERFKKGYKKNIDKLLPMYLHPKDCNARIK